MHILDIVTGLLALYAVYMSVQIWRAKRLLNRMLTDFADREPN